MVFRKYLVIVTIISLLMWGPIDHSRPEGLIIRISYLILIPTIIWFLIGWIWRNWQISITLENRLIRILSSLICIALIILAFIEAKSDTHLENALWIQTRDGREAVGEDIIASGPDWVNVFILITISALTFWFGVLKKKFHK